METTKYNKMIRPYTEKEMTAFHLCAVVNKKNRQIKTITGWDAAAVEVSGMWFFYHEILEQFEFFDGSPCGIEEEEI